MSSKTKIFFMVIGLLVCLIVVLTAKFEMDDQNTEAVNKTNSYATSQVIVITGTQFIIQTTYSLLKPIQ